MRTLIILAVALCVAPALAQPKDDARRMLPPPTLTEVIPRLPSSRAKDVDTQIKQDLEDFAQEFNTLELSIKPVFDGYAFIYHSRAGIFGASEWTRQLKFSLGAELVIDNVRVIKHNDNDATAIVGFHFDFPDYIREEKRAQGELIREEQVQFKLAPRIFAFNTLRWQIVAPTAPPPKLTEDFYLTRAVDLNFWSNIAYYLSQRQAIPANNLVDQRSIFNLKLLGLGVLLLVQDYDDVYAFDPRYLIEAIAPYVQSPAVFQIPDTNELYTFNVKLSGLKKDDVKEDYQTVLFYEGQNEKPTFRYDGKAAICFADGHVALVTPDEAKNLIWQP